MEENLYYLILYITHHFIVYVHHVVEHTLLTMWICPSWHVWGIWLLLWPGVLLSFWICLGIVLRWCNLCLHMPSANSIPALWEEMKRTVLGKNQRDTNWNRLARRIVLKMFWGLWNGILMVQIFHTGNTISYKDRPMWSALITKGK